MNKLNARLLYNCNNIPDLFNSERLPNLKTRKQQSIDEKEQRINRIRAVLRKFQIEFPCVDCIHALMKFYRLLDYSENMIDNFNKPAFPVGRKIHVAEYICKAKKERYLWQYIEERERTGNDITTFPIIGITWTTRHNQKLLYYDITCYFENVDFGCNGKETIEIYQKKGMMERQEDFRVNAIKIKNSSGFSTIL